MKPTAAELEILNVLWRMGPATVREIHASLERDQGYTTILKLLQIMTQKGLVVRSERDRAHEYRAKHSREDMQAHLVDDLAERAFGGSAASLALRALSRKRATREEIAEVRRLLDEFERKNRGKRD